MNIYCGNLSYRMNDKRFRNSFAKFGAVKSAKLLWIKRQEDRKVLHLFEMEDSLCW